MTINLPLVAISVGATLLTLLAVYIGWRSYRVVLLRLKLLTIRNNLWDAAHESNMLDNGCYRQYRHGLNLLIQQAHRVDLITLALSVDFDRDGADDLLRDVPEVIAKAIDTAVSDAGAALHRYIIWDRPFTGIFLFKLIGILERSFKLMKFLRGKPWSSTKESAKKIGRFGRQSKKNATKWVRSNGPAYAFSAGAIVSTMTPPTC